MNDNTPAHRPIRSYVRREGRITKGQARALARFDDYKLVCTDTLNRTQLDHQRPNTTHLLEIGFGMGGSLASLCSAYPHTTFVGAEVLEKGVGSLLHHAQTHDLKNLLVHHGDAVELVARTQDATFDCVHVFFPDPWHKARHHKRRLLSKAFIHQLARILMPGGLLHVKTDWQEYAISIQKHLDECLLLVNAVVSHPLRMQVPETRFEQRGKRLGHAIHTLCATRTKEAYSQ